MRDASIAVLRKIGVESGGSNVQFALNPDDGRLLIIEMNPRVSRSSALASKATGFPIAKIAAKLAVGYTLDELQERHHRRRDAGVVRADHRLRRHQDSALHVREIPRRQRPPDDADEVGRRGDGDRPHVPGVAAEGAAQPGDRHRRPRSDRRRCRSPKSEQHRLREELRMPGPNRIRYVARCVPRRLAVRRSAVAVAHRSVVPRADRGPGARGSRRCSEQGLAAFERDRVRALKRKGFSDRRLATLLGHRRGQRAPPPRDDGHPSGLQARRHLRRGVRDLDRVHVLDLRRGVRGEPDRPHARS